MSGYNPYGPNSYGYSSQGFATSSSNYNPQQMQWNGNGMPNNGINTIAGDGQFYRMAGQYQTDPTFGHIQSAIPAQMPVYMDAQAVPIPMPMPMPVPAVLHALSANHQKRRDALAKLEKAEEEMFDLEQKKQKLLVNDQEIETELAHRRKLISIQWEKMRELTFGHGQQMQFQAPQNPRSTSSLETPTHMDYETSADSAYSSNASSNVPPSVEQQEEGQQQQEMAHSQLQEMAQFRQLEVAQLQQLEVVQPVLYPQEQQFMSQQEVQPVRQQQLQEQQQFMAQQAQHVQHVQQQQLQQQMEGLAQAQQPEILHFKLTTLAEIEECLKKLKKKREKWQDEHRLYTVGPAEAKERHFKELSTVMPSFDERLMEVGEAVLWHINKKCGHQICNYIYSSIEQHDEKASSLFKHFLRLLPIIKHQPLFQIVSYDVKKQSKYLLNLEIELLCKDLLANWGFVLEAECWLIDEKNGHKFEQFCIIDEAFQAHGKEEKAELLCKNPLARLKMDVCNMDYTAVKKDLHIFKRNNNNRKLHENAYKIEFHLKLRTPYLAMKNDVMALHKCTAGGLSEKLYCRLMHKDQQYNNLRKEQLVIPHAKVVRYHGQHYIVEASEFHENVDEAEELALHFFK